MRLENIMPLFLNEKCSVTALMVKKQCSAVQSNALHCGQVHENAKEIAITALTALSSAVTLHFVNKIKHLLSCARAGAHAPTT